MNAVETTSLTMRYGRRTALADCTLAVPRGHVVALVGPNGAGKTTLLQLATGLLRPTSGRIEVLGRPAGQRRDRVGFVAQDAALYSSLSIADLLRLGRDLNGRWDGAGAQARIDALDLPANQRFGKLSGGQQSQVALAVALAKRPELLILDEPLARLDPLARHEFMGTLMAAVVDLDVTVIFSSHVLAELERYCDYLVVIRAGAVQLAGEVEELLTRHAVLTGPVAGADPLAARHPVVADHRTGAQAQLLVRTPAEAPDLPTGWTRHAIGLDDLVLSYLRAPGSAALPGPKALVTT